ncbi:MAG: hypothetical protein QF898_14695 [SAR202 cluster bacterium]|nr:hypothetical protein [SAR202 cluster bacterium]MDP6514336.1 hypothetical protein [SAR202 cluster bacterium]
MAERAKNNLKEIDALKALSLDDLPEGGLDNLWSRLKTIMADRPDPSQGMGAAPDRRADAQAALQKAEQGAMQATNVAFDKMRVEADEELASAQKIKTAAAQKHQEAEAAVAQANEFKTMAKQQADEMLSEASSRVDTMLADAQDKIRQITIDSEQQGEALVQEAETAAQEIVAGAQAKAKEVADLQVGVLKSEAIEEIKMVRDGIARMQAELEEELETQRILTDAARLNMVSGAVAAGAGNYVEKVAATRSAVPNGHQNGSVSESQAAPPSQNTPAPQVEAQPQQNAPAAQKAPPTQQNTPTAQKAPPAQPQQQQRQAPQEQNGTRQPPAQE